MLKLIESSVAAIEQRLVLVAPLHVSRFDAFTNVTNDTAQNRRLVEEMQRLRGSIYLDEGNVKHHQLTSDGRHRTPEDDLSWHLLMTDQAGHVRSCALYFEHENASTIGDLRLKNCPLAPGRQSPSAEPRRDRHRPASVEHVTAELAVLSLEFSVLSSEF